MKDTFYVGDMVELLPYDEVDYSYGIFEENWEMMVRNNPLTIEDIDDDIFWFEGFHYWVKAPAFVRYIPPQLVEVGDLI